jgi:hypothetical protein
MKCRFVRKTGKQRTARPFTGPSASEVIQAEFVDVTTGETCWDYEWLPGSQFGAGTIVSSNNFLWLITRSNKEVTEYYDLTKYEREGEPPMLSILNPPACWTLVKGEFTNGNRDSLIQVSSRTEI